jgi:hypothetical protein
VYGSFVSGQRVETDFSTIAATWDDLGLVGVVSGDATGLHQINFHIPSLANEQALWNDISKNTTQQLSFDADGNAAVSADFGAFTNTGEFRLIGLPARQAPQVAITQPRNGATVSGTVVVQAAAETDTGASAELFMDGISLGQRSAAPFEWAWNTADISVAEGGHILTVVGRGIYGSREQSISVTVDNTTFDDVPKTSWQWPYVEALVRAAITSGCSAIPPLYCPYSTVTRAEMAKFLCISAGKQPLDRDVPTFADVPKAYWAYGFIERLADAASWGGSPPTNGCRLVETALHFCPFDIVTREQMAKFLCVATGKSAMPSCSGVFADVASSNPLCRFIERLADPASWPGGTVVASDCACPSGYPSGSKCYCPKSNVQRGQMAALLVRAFGIPL